MLFHPVVLAQLAASLVDLVKEATDTVESTAALLIPLAGSTRTVLNPPALASLGPSVLSKAARPLSPAVSTSLLYPAGLLGRLATTAITARVERVITTVVSLAVYLLLYLRSPRGLSLRLLTLLGPNQLVLVHLVRVHLVRVHLVRAHLAPDPPRHLAARLLAQVAAFLPALVQAALLPPASLLRLLRTASKALSLPASLAKPKILHYCTLANSCIFVDRNCGC